MEENDHVFKEIYEEFNSEKRKGSWISIDKIIVFSAFRTKFLTIYQVKTRKPIINDIEADRIFGKVENLRKAGFFSEYHGITDRRRLRLRYEIRNSLIKKLFNEYKSKHPQITQDSLAIFNTVRNDFTKFLEEKIARNFSEEQIDNTFWQLKNLRKAGFFKH